MIDIDIEDAAWTAALPDAEALALAAAEATLASEGAFPKLSRTPGAVRWPGPALGAHTDEVLKARAGCSDARLAELRARAII